MPLHDQHLSLAWSMRIWVESVELNCKFILFFRHKNNSCLYLVYNFKLYYDFLYCQIVLYSDLRNKKICNFVAEQESIESFFSFGQELNQLRGENSLMASILEHNDLKFAVWGRTDAIQGVVVQNLMDLVKNKYQGLIQIIRE